MTERKPTRPSSLYRMNRAASMRIEENKKKVTVATETIMRRSIRRTPRPGRRTSAQTAAPITRIEVEENSVSFLPKDSQRLPQDRRRMASGVPYVSDSAIDMRDRSSFACLVSKPLDISISRTSASSALIERSVKPDVIRASEILIEDVVNSPIKIDEIKPVDKGWRVVDCLKALKSTIFRESDVSEGPQENKATQVEKTGGFSCTSGLCQKMTRELDKKPVLVQTEAGNDGKPDSARKNLGMDPLKELSPLAEPRRILNTEGNKLNLQECLKPLADEVAGNMTSSRPAGVKTSMGCTNVASQSDTASHPCRLGDKASIAPPTTEHSVKSSAVRGPPVVAEKPIISRVPAAIPSPKLKASATRSNSESRVRLMERERKLQTIRMLEEKVANKQLELASTRKQLRLSLEEEMENNRRLESILAKIKAIRKAGEKGAFATESESKALRDKGKGLS